MTTGVIERSTSQVLEGIRGVRDALTVRRAFGDPLELDGVTVIPVARVGGGAGGGGGEGPDPDPGGADTGRTSGGLGAGFGLGVQPVGVYEVRGDHVTWKPSVDANRVIRGGQMLVGVIAVCATMVLLSRSRHS